MYSTIYRAFEQVVTEKVKAEQCNTAHSRWYNKKVLTFYLGPYRQEQNTANLISVRDNYCDNGENLVYPQDHKAAFLFSITQGGAFLTHQINMVSIVLGHQGFDRIIREAGYV